MLVCRFVNWKLCGNILLKEIRTMCHDWLQSLWVCNLPEALETRKKERATFNLNPHPKQKKWLRNQMNLASTFANVNRCRGFTCAWVPTIVRVVFTRHAYNSRWRCVKYWWRQSVAAWLNNLAKYFKHAKPSSEVLTHLRWYPALT